MKISTCIVNFSTILTLLACGTNSNQKSDEQNKAIPDSTIAPQSAKQTASPSSAETSLFIEDESKLPQCDSGRQGALAYVKSTLKFMNCQGNNWITVEIKGEQGAKGDKGEPGAIAVAAPTPTPTPTPTPAIESFFTLRLSYFVGYHVSQNFPFALTRSTNSIILPLKRGKIAMAKLSCTLRQIDESLYECEYKESPFNNKPCSPNSGDNSLRENRDIFSFNYDDSKSEISAQLQNGRYNQDRTELIYEPERMLDHCGQPNWKSHLDIVINP